MNGAAGGAPERAPGMRPPPTGWFWLGVGLIAINFLAGFFKNNGMIDRGGTLGVALWWLDKLDGPLIVVSLFRDMAARGYVRFLRFAPAVVIVTTLGVFITLATHHWHAN